MSLKRKEIVDYIAKNNLTAQKSGSGLYYVIKGWRWSKTNFIINCNGSV
jgi:hypothetical protein